MRGRKATIGLSILVVAIWGNIVHRLIGTMDDSDTNIPSPISIASHTPRWSERFEFKGDVRDPFSLAVSAPIISTKRPATPRVEPSPDAPALKLAGVLSGRKRGTAMIESVDGNVFFLREGDTLQGVRILAIGHDAVTYLHHRKKLRLTLENESSPKR